MKNRHEKNWVTIETIVMYACLITITIYVISLITNIIWAINAITTYTVYITGIQITNKKISVNYALCKPRKQRAQDL